ALNSEKFKLQFARIGDPALNPAVIDTIEEVRETYSPPNYMPCISTIAPDGTEDWFERLKRLNHNTYEGRFQLQFSVHSTDEEQRDHLMPDKKWSLDEIADYGEEFYIGGRKVTLNFALSENDQIDPQKLEDIFDPEVFAVKVTPLNPTCNARKNELINIFTEEDTDEYPVIEELDEGPFELHLSIGELEENEIKSNCGQILLSHFEEYGIKGA
ncbi:MAG: radical SAM protein, partial [Candidatus Natronoplasma sp.]